VSVCFILCVIYLDPDIALDFDVNVTKFACLFLLGLGLAFQIFI